MPSTEETTAHQDRSVVPPTRQDKIAAAGSELIGGPLGRWAWLGTSWWTPVGCRRWSPSGCSRSAWCRSCPATTAAGSAARPRSTPTPATRDIPHLYCARGFADRPRARTSTSCRQRRHAVPGVPGPDRAVHGGRRLADPAGGTIQHREQMYWMVNAGMLMVCAAVIAVCVARTHRRRPWDALLVALAPAFALTATINWDLLAVALTAAAMLHVVPQPPAGFRRPHRPRHRRQALPACCCSGRCSCSAGGPGGGGRSARRARRRGRRLAGGEPAGDAARAARAGRSSTPSARPGRSTSARSG